MSSSEHSSPSSPDRNRSPAKRRRSRTSLLREWSNNSNSEGDDDDSGPAADQRQRTRFWGSHDDLPSTPSARSSRSLVTQRSSTEKKKYVTKQARPLFTFDDDSPLADNDDEEDFLSPPLHDASLERRRRSLSIERMLESSSDDDDDDLLGSNPFSPASSSTCNKPPAKNKQPLIKKQPFRQASSTNAASTVNSKKKRPPAASLPSRHQNDKRGKNEDDEDSNCSSFESSRRRPGQRSRRRTSRTRSRAGTKTTGLFAATSATAKRDGSDQHKNQSRPPPIRAISRDLPPLPGTQEEPIEFDSSSSSEDESDNVRKVPAYTIRHSPGRSHEIIELEDSDSESVVVATQPSKRPAAQESSVAPATQHTTKATQVNASTSLYSSMDQQNNASSSPSSSSAPQNRQRTLSPSLPAQPSSALTLSSSNPTSAGRSKDTNDNATGCSRKEESAAATSVLTGSSSSSSSDDGELYAAIPLSKPETHSKKAPTLVQCANAPPNNPSLIQKGTANHLDQIGDAYCDPDNCNKHSSEQASTSTTSSVPGDDVRPGNMASLGVTVILNTTDGECDSGRTVAKVKPNVNTATNSGDSPSPTRKRSAKQEAKLWPLHSKKTLQYRKKYLKKAKDLGNPVQVDCGKGTYPAIIVLDLENGNSEMVPGPDLVRIQWSDSQEREDVLEKNIRRDLETKRGSRGRDGAPSPATKRSRPSRRRIKPDFYAPLMVKIEEQEDGSGQDAVKGEHFSDDDDGDAGGEEWNPTQRDKKKARHSTKPIKSELNGANPIRRGKKKARHSTKRVKSDCNGAKAPPPMAPVALNSTSSMDYSTNTDAMSTASLKTEPVETPISDRYPGVTGHHQETPPSPPRRNYPPVRHVVPSPSETGRKPRTWKGKPKSKCPHPPVAPLGSKVYFLDLENCTNQIVETLCQQPSATVVGESRFGYGSSHERLLQLLCDNSGERWYLPESAVQLPLPHVFYQ